MAADDWSLVSRAFEAAVDAAPAARPALVARALGGRDDLADEVARLLDATDTGPGPLDGTALDLLEAQADAGGEGACDDDADLSGRRAGPVTLSRRLASGGMGDVYLGERRVGEAKRRVAVKVLKRGLDTDALLARFRREQETLAALHHEGVVAFLDAGALPDGRPYLVMEHVDGLPLTAWCDREEADVRARVDLARRTCEVVQFAHQELVLHRDLKPDNILVTDDGRPKLLDFGVATLLRPGGDDAVTDAGRAPLTWRYASPEQLAGGRVSVATDVHALGLVLYELLAGSPARTGEPEELDVPALSSPYLPQMPPPPSVVAAADPARAGQAALLSGDLDAVVMRALDPEPARRHPSASALAEDLRCWLDGEPVSARRGPIGERTGRWLRAHRGAALTALATLALVAALLAGTWLGKRRAEAEASRGWGAHAQARYAAFFLEQLMVEGLAESPEGRASLDERVEDELAQRPETRALVRLALGHLALERGRPVDAERQLLEALGIGPAGKGLNTSDKARARTLLERAREEQR
jgi:tRNA A-37 threonylcarbamoyl transferase component Bud32